MCACRGCAGAVPDDDGRHGRRAQDSRAWWAAVWAGHRIRRRRSEVRAVAVTSQGADAFVPVDSAGEPTAPALTWLDRRATAEWSRIAELAPNSRNGADPFFGTAKLPWLAEHRASALERAEHVLSCNSFIIHRIAVLDETTASLMQEFDEGSGDFADAVRSAEPTLRFLPPIVAARPAWSAR